MKKIISTIVILIMILFTMISCNICQSESSIESSRMFVTIEKSVFYDIVYNKDTGVMYAISNYSNNRGNFTLLVNSDGSPMIYGGINYEKVFCLL